MPKKFFWLFALGTLAQAQWFGGGTAGLATLSGDAATSIEPSRSRIALYSPRNGFAFQVFAGKHVREYFSLQAAYGWNRNQVTFTGLDTLGGIEQSFEQVRTIRQQSLGLDGMIYFRPRKSRFRPYVSGGAGWIHLDSKARTLSSIKGNPALPADTFAANKPYWRTAVGMDLRLSKGWQFRYSFWETVSANPLSAQLRPRGKALFLNFLNQFGFVREF